MIIVALVWMMICLIFGLAGGLLYLACIPLKRWLIKTKKLSNQQSRKIKIAYIFIILFFATWSTYDAFYPGDSFYKDEFINNTGIALPSSAIVKHKAASYPDFHGDYGANAVIVLSNNDYAALETGIRQNPAFVRDTSLLPLGTSEEYDRIAAHVDEQNITKTYAKTIENRSLFKVAFFNDRKTIVFEHSCW